MDHLRHKYLEEAHDLLQQLEQALLILEENPADKENSDTVFRVMHTLKGSSSMFGFQKVGELTHLLENCFEHVREGKVHAGEELISLTFSALDHIRNLLKDPECKETATKELHSLLLQKTIALYDDMALINGISKQTTKDNHEKTFLIWFQPHTEILKSGTNPLYVLDDISRLGSLLTFIDYKNLPSLEEIDPLISYLSWGMLLVTNQDLAAVQDVFLFVDHLCDLEIIEVAKRNVLGNLEEEQLTALEKIFEEEEGEAVLKSFKGFIQQITFASAEQSNSGNESLTAKEALTSSIRVASDKLDDLMNLISELVASQASLSMLAEKGDNPELVAVAEEMEKITRRLRDKTFDICLIPIENNLTRFKRLVRDLSKELNKKIIFEAEGVETELDKNVIEHLSDCLIHIFRNSIDHGIEDETERIGKGKDPEGKILLKAYNSGANVIIEVQDDGAGIDPKRVRQKGLDRGLITEDQVLNEHEIFELLFQPGFSTAREITEVSGRGVGMDVVRRKINEIRGKVTIQSKLNHGTAIKIAIPLTISIIDGLLVRIANTDFVLPLSFIEKSYSINNQDLKDAINNQLILNGEPTPYFDLSADFGKSELSGYGFAIVINASHRRIALVVEEIVGEYQAVLKPLGKFYKDIEFISGASLKGDGTIALVIDPQKLIENLSKQNIMV